MKLVQIMLPLILFSCSALEGEQKTNVNDIIKTQEIKRVSRADIIIHASKMGSEIVSQISSTKATSDTCRFFDPDVKDSLQNAMNSKITLGFNAGSFSLETERQLYEAYLYNEENNLPSKSSVESIGDDKVLFTAPLEMAQGDLKNCSTDSSRFGMWSVVLPIKTVVNDL